MLAVQFYGLVKDRDIECLSKLRLNAFKSDRAKDMDAAALAILATFSDMIKLSELHDKNKMIIKSTPSAQLYIMV